MARPSPSARDASIGYVVLGGTWVVAWHLIASWLVPPAWSEVVGATAGVALVGATAVGLYGVLDDGSRSSKADRAPGRAGAGRAADGATGSGAGSDDPDDHPGAGPDGASGDLDDQPGADPDGASGDPDDQPGADPAGSGDDSTETTADVRARPSGDSTTPTAAGLPGMDEFRARRAEILQRVLRHDLRNEVSVIRGYGDLIAEETNDPALLDHLDAIFAAADSLDQISRQAKRLDRVAAADRERTRIDVPATVEDCAEALRAAYPDCELAVTVEGTAVVRADPDIDVALMEVLENGLLHNESPNPRVDVTVTPVDADRVQVVVADNGNGIPDVEREVIDARTETPLAHSEGLGLWLATLAVDQSGGTIEIDTTQNRGTRVALTLPRAKPEERGAVVDAPGRNEGQSPGS